VWLPPDFEPNNSTPSGRALTEQIAAFERAHPNVVVEVRLKAAAGTASLLNNLSAAYNAAPGVLPNLVALHYDDLLNAAQAGLITPLEPLVPTDNLASAYPVAQALSRVNGQWMGAPFALDARVLVYNAEAYATPPLQWRDLVTGTFIFPGSEASSLTLLNLYLALGGTLADANGRPTLDAELLARALEQLQNFNTDGRIPMAALDYADPSATWQVFRERRATLAATSAHWYLAEYFRFGNARATVLPSDGQRLALAEGWSWAMVNTRPEEQALTAELLLWLIAPERLGAWTSAAQLLPTSPQALNHWPSERLVAFASDVLLNAQPRPSAPTLTWAGPSLQLALSDVLNGRATPLAAATLAAETVNNR
jgi:ABC-type glycerol-3-phosphate transport system substrate-binding protein